MNAAARRTVLCLLDNALAHDGGSLLDPIRLRRSDAVALRALLAPASKLRAGAGSSGEGRPVPARPKRPATAVPKPIRDVVLARANGRCEACGGPSLFPHLHHRKLRSHGGQHTPENLIACDWRCHHAIHNVIPRADAEAWGLIVPSHADPADIPVVAGLSAHSQNRDLA